MFKQIPFKRYFSRMITVLGVVTFIIIVISIISALLFSQPGVPGKVVLELELDQDYQEMPAGSALDQLSGKQPNVILNTVEALQLAATDDRVVAIIAHIGSNNMGQAKVQEIRDAVLAFRKSGKPAIAWAETIGGTSSGTRAYHLASAFDQIYLNPEGALGISGLSATTPFIKGALDKLAINPRAVHRYEYKSATNLFTETAYTPAHREASQAVLDSQFKQIVNDIAKARDLKSKQVKYWMDQGVVFADEALQAGLIDGVLYRDQVYQQLFDKVGESELLYSREYFQRSGGLYDSGDGIALIYGVGTIVSGPSQNGPLTGQTMGSDTVTLAFRHAIADDNIKAIIFRIDSGGGLALASDIIRREIVRAREVGKPVIVSMSDVAGSGGYYVAMDADKIVAQPGTITGSIGVALASPYTRDFYKKLGITFGTLTTSKNGTLYSGVNQYSAAQWQRINSAMDKSYQSFISKVAHGRGMTVADVHKIAKGRIWTGEDAKRLGLVDALGGFDVAIRLAKQAAGIDADDNIELVEFPKRKSGLQQLMAKPAANSDTQMNSISLQLFSPALENILGPLLGLSLLQPGIVMHTPIYVIQ